MSKVGSIEMDGLRAVVERHTDYEVTYFDASMPGVAAYLARDVVSFGLSLDKLTMVERGVVSRALHMIADDLGACQLGHVGPDVTVDAHHSICAGCGEPIEDDELMSRAELEHRAPHEGRR